MRSLRTHLWKDRIFEFLESSEAELPVDTRPDNTIGTPLIMSRRSVRQTWLVGIRYKISIKTRAIKGRNCLFDRYPEVLTSPVSMPRQVTHISSDDEGQLNCLWDLGDFEPNQREVLTFTTPAFETRSISSRFTITTKQFSVPGSR